MANSRKSMINMIWDSNYRTPVSSNVNSSPLRRKSMIATKTPSTDLLVNNDEVERLERRREIDTMSTPSSTRTNRRVSMGFTSLSELPSPKIAEGINECIKLGAKNKINIKNAFSLKIIDYMALMLKKINPTGYDLRVGSTSLDVSTKIYGYRVDGVHQECLKLAAGHDKHSNLHDEDENELNEDTFDNNNDENPQETKRKKSNRSKKNKNLISTREALEREVETCHPRAMMSIVADSQSSDMLHQATLPHHSTSKYYLHQYDDVILDRTDQDNSWSDITTEIPLFKIKIPEDATICPSFENFEFLGWSMDDELKNTPPAELSNKSILQFDLDASLPANNESSTNEINHFDLNDDEENIDRCIPEPNLRRENIVDFRQLLARPGLSNSSEYLCASQNMNHHWAGPSHWKMKNFLRNNNSVLNKLASKPNSETVKKRKELVINFEEPVEGVNEAFLSSAFVKITSKTIKTNWLEKSITLPVDNRYDIIEFNKFYNQGSVMSLNKAKAPSNLPEEATNYDYNNENDVSNYCANTSNVDFHGNDHDTSNDGGSRLGEDVPSESQVHPLGINLVAPPKLSNKTSIGLSLRAKKLDMRQLKKCIWNCISSNDKENINSQKTGIEQTQDKNNEIKKFSNIYKTVPTMLSKNNIEALSVPIAFISLLHLANEKQLLLNSSTDGSDLDIKQE